MILFKLRPRTLFYASSRDSEIFYEIDLFGCIIAESGNKNQSCSFEVRIYSISIRKYCSESRLSVTHVLVLATKSLTYLFDLTRQLRVIFPGNYKSGSLIIFFSVAIQPISESLFFLLKLFTIYMNIHNYFNLADNPYGENRIKREK